MLLRTTETCVIRSGCQPRSGPPDPSNLYRLPPPHSRRT